MDHPSGKRKPRLPNLDGLRAFSVLLVVLFHGQVLHFVGGYVGVSVFFTISGYLLTHRLLSKPLNAKAIGRYWSGRWRRILPAAWAVLLVIVAVEWLSDRVPEGAGTRLWRTAAGLGNWQQLWKGSGSYAEMVQHHADTMVHYWSLGVEEQAYLVLPLVLFLVVRLRSGRARLGIVLALAAGSFALPFLAHLSVNRTYYGTDTRAGEILIGVALAVAHQTGIVPRRATQRAASVMCAVGLAGITAIALTVRSDSELIRRGLLPGLAVLSAVMLHGAVSSRSPLGGLFETEPMRFLGAVSYPVYLIHWPLMTVLRWHDQPNWVVAPVGLVGASLLSMPLIRYVEIPLRRKAPTPLWSGWVAATAAMLAVLTIVIVPPDTFLGQLERDQAAAASAATTAPPVTSSPGTSPSTAPGDTTLPQVTTTTTPPLPTVSVFGDSAALSVALLLNGQVPRDQINYIGSSTMLGCGLVHELEPARCDAVPDQWTTYLSQMPTDVAVLLSCQWELVERDVPGKGAQVVGQPAIDAIIEQGYRQAVDLLLANGVRTVAWMLCPQFSTQHGNDAVPEVTASRDPARVKALDEIIRRVAAEYDDVVLIDLYTFMQPYTDDGDLRPDGAHFSYDHPNQLSEALPGMLRDALAAKGRG